MASMTPNPLSDPAFGPAPFSPVKLAVSSSRTDASQPCTKQSWKWSRSREPPVRASNATAARTAVLMVRSAAGHDEA
uniref:Uncharacterized protein n=1 Tax=Arundo donax TaxID=35708 RepID=A0A0A9GKB4_ARUDO